MCEVLQSGFVNTDPGGGAVCKDQLVEFPDQPVDPILPAGPVVFGNVEAGSFTITKSVDDGSGLVPADTEFTVRVECERNGNLVAGFPRDYTLQDGETVSVGPLFDGTECTITEPGDQGADVTITPSTVEIPDDDGTQVSVDNAYPAGDIELRKVVDGGLASKVPAETAFTVEVTCRFPAGYPVQGGIPGYDPLEVKVLSGALGQPGPPVDIGPLPDGAECDFVETADNGATEVEFSPSDQIVVDASNQGPIDVVVTNTFGPAALRIWKVIDPDGAPVPPETEFRAEVVCTFDAGPTTITTFDETVTFGIGEPNAYIVDNQPVGAVCAVDEVTTGLPLDGSPVYNPGQTVDLIGDNPVSVDLTITNKFVTGSLEVVKAIDAGGFVSSDVGYVLRVDCFYDGSRVPADPSFPRDITLSQDTGLSAQVDNLPLDSECTVIEVDSQGADDITIEPDQPVTIDTNATPITVTVTNSYDLASFDITKRVVDPSGLVPGGTQFTVQIDCTFPADWPGLPVPPPAGGVRIPGFNPKELTLTYPGAPTASSGDLPVGSTCEIEETDTAGAGSVVVTPDQIVVGDPTGPAEVIVENTYPVGALKLQKAVDDGGSGLIPPTDFVLNVACTYPTDWPGLAQPPPAGGVPVPGFEDLDVTVKSGVGGAPGAAVRVGVDGLPDPNNGIPAGSSCTITEPDSQGASVVTIVPAQPVIVTDDLQNPVEVLATNVYPVANAEIRKLTTGDLAETLAPEGTQFQVEITCAYPAGFPVSGDIPGYDPLDLIIEAGRPNVPGQAVGFGPLPVGSECAIVEISAPPGSSPSIDPDPLTIGSDSTNTVTVTNVYNGVGLLITKTVDGDGGDLVPPSLEYTVRARCRDDQTTTIYYYDETVPISPGSPAQLPGPGEIPGLTPETFCEVTEEESYGADVTITPDGEFQLPGSNAQPPLVVNVSIENEFEEGALRIIKDVSGELNGLVPDDAEFRIGVNCSIGDVRLVGFPVEVVLTPAVPDEMLTDLPVGATCFATESDTNGATSPPTFTPPYDPAPPDPLDPFRSGDVVVTDDLDDPISITVTNEYPGAIGEIVKVVDGPQGGLVPPNTEFDFKVTCSYPANHPAAPGVVPGWDEKPFVLLSGSTVGQSGRAVEIGPVPPGSSCLFEETGNNGATDVTIEPNPLIVTTVDKPYVTATATNTFSAGGLTLTKVVDGAGAGFIPADTIYPVQVRCLFNGNPVLAETVELVAGVSQTIEPLEIGTECTIVETDSNGADVVTIEPPSPVTVTAGTATVDVTITNTYLGGQFDIVKVVDGDLAELVTPGTEFPVEVTCSYPAPPYPLQGEIAGFDPLMTTIESGPAGQEGPPTVIGPLPSGSTCSIVETDNGGANSVTIVPDTVIVPNEGQTPVKVVVTNTFDSAALRVVKVLNGPGAGDLPADTEFVARVVCTPPAESPATGFDGEVTFGVDDPAIVAGQALGSSCAVTETETNGATDVSYAPSQTVVLEGEQPVSVDVTVTNTIGVGSLVVTKALAGGGGQFVPDATVFLISVDCSFDGARLAGFPEELRLAAPDGSDTVTGLPIGSTCTVSETEPHGAQEVAITPAQPVTIDGTTAVEVTVTNTYDTGALVINKEITGPGVLFAKGPFLFTLECTFLDQPLNPQPTVPQINLPSLSTTVDGIPIGSSCTVREVPPYGGALGPPEVVPSSVVIDGETDVSFTVINTFGIPNPLPNTGSNNPIQLAAIAAAILAIGATLAMSSNRRRTRAA